MLCTDSTQSSICSRISKRYVLPYQNDKPIIWYISVLIFTSWKRTKVAKRILKTNVNNGKCDNMGNIKKSVIHVP